MDAMIIWGVAVAAGVALWLLKTSMLDQPINANAARLARMSKAEPDAALQEQQKRLQRSSDLAGWLLLALQVLTIALLPAWPSARIYEAMQSAAFGWLVIATLILLLQLELSPFFYQSIARMRLRGLATGALTGAIALGALLIIVTLPLAEHAGVPHPVDLASVRRFLLGNMAFCGGLTLLREQRRRVRSGDMLRYGARDSLYVALQLLIVFNVAAMAIAAPLIMIVQITGLLDPRQTIAASLNLLAFIWTCVSIAYLFLYFLRRVSQARGFSWLDPPNWRVAMPHLRYNFRAYGALQVLTFAVVLAAVLALSRPGQLFGWLGGWRRGALAAGALLAGVALLLYRNRPPESRGLAWLRPARWPGALARAFRNRQAPPLADIVRVTYLRALLPGAQHDEQLAERVAQAAVIAPLAGQPGPEVVRFDIIGDPGEGDESQLYPTNRRHGAARQQISASKERKPAASADDLLLRALIDPAAPADDAESIDFSIVSSDVIYPGGEIFDYERAFYRPNAPRDKHGRMFEYGHGSDRPGALNEILDRSPPCYAIPGNHDWYDSLHGFLLNFSYNAAIGAPAPGLARLKDMPWDWRPWRRADRRRAAALRRRYRLRAIGGLVGQPATQQRLSFFEVALGEAPLSVFGLDNGVTGSVDVIQYRWLERRLAEIRAGRDGAQRYIIVLVGNPLYVDGRFDGSAEAPDAAAPQPQRSYSPREIYELLRRYQADVVIGGDTHAYQRYEVRYYDEQGREHTMHHIVNGGGGAYLSPPMDAGWLDFAQGLAPRLSKRGVYHPGVWGRDAAADGRADEATLHDVFPTMNEMMAKFVWSQADAGQAAGPYHRISAPIALYRRLETWLRRQYVRGALASGFTNALNHDEHPLLQSYVRVELVRHGDSWQLRLVPYMEQGDELQRQDARQLVLPERPAAPENTPYE